jgi:DNA (cytosine-5)-methyltransferase 1
MIVSNYGSAKSGPHQQGWTRDAHTNVLGTHTAKDTHAIVVYRGDGQASRVESPMLTVATTEQHALASVVPAIEECTFRMLEPSEIARGMVMHLNAYGDPYVIHGNRRDRVRQLGNAVTPPVVRALVAAIKESLA